MSLLVRFHVHVFFLHFSENPKKRDYFFMLCFMRFLEQWLRGTRSTGDAKVWTPRCFASAK